jgi:hypothetical protein
VKIRISVIIGLVVMYLTASAISSYVLYDSKSNYVYTKSTMELRRHQCLQGSNWASSGSHSIHAAIVEILGCISGLVDGIRLTWNNGERIDTKAGSDGSLYVLDALRLSPGEYDTAWSAELLHAPIMYMKDSNVVAIQKR